MKKVLYYIFHYCKNREKSRHQLIFCLRLLELLAILDCNPHQRRIAHPHILEILELNIKIMLILKGYREKFWIIKEKSQIRQNEEGSDKLLRVFSPSNKFAEF